jgi:hypothetical protein
MFGAQNVGVENPSWMSGGVQVLGNLTLPYNRMVIIGFAAAGAGWAWPADRQAPAWACSCAASRRTARWRPAWA